MRIVYIFQTEREGGHSIREQFQAIGTEVSREAEVILYELRGASFLLADIRRLRQLCADIYHITGNVNYVVPFLPKGRVVLTVADIGHYLFGLKGLRRFVYGWLWFRVPLKFADVITCISDETRRNLVRNFRIRETEIRLIPACVKKVFEPSLAKKFESNSPVILQVGTSDYKNVPRVVRALKGVNCRLVIIGRVSPILKGALLNSGLRWSSDADIPFDDVVSHYRRCDLVTFISIGEGFGVPILEAQAAGIPLVTSNVAPLRDVAGPGACLADPMDESSIRAAIMKLIEDSDYRHSVVARGLENVSQYTVAVVCQQYLALYSGMLNRRFNPSRNSCQ